MINHIIFVYQVRFSIFYLLPLAFPYSLFYSVIVLALIVGLASSSKGSGYYQTLVGQSRTTCNRKKRFRRWFPTSWVCGSIG
ncbi:hypothetical protein CsSME_00023194 [Camellia sinensis var. sinensis]